MFLLMMSKLLNELNKPLDNQSCLFSAMNILLEEQHHKSISLTSKQQTKKLKIIFTDLYFYTVIIQMQFKEGVHFPECQRKVFFCIGLILETTEASLSML